jgi:hypothetical protein
MIKYNKSTLHEVAAYIENIYTHIDINSTVSIISGLVSDYCHNDTYKIAIRIFFEGRYYDKLNARGEKDNLIRTAIFIRTELTEKGISTDVANIVVGAALVTNGVNIDDAINDITLCTTTSDHGRQTQFMCDANSTLPSQSQSLPHQHSAIRSAINAGASLRYAMALTNIIKRAPHFIIRYFILIPLGIGLAGWALLFIYNNLKRNIISAPDLTRVSPPSNKSEQNEKLNRINKEIEDLTLDGDSSVRIKKINDLKARLINEYGLTITKDFISKLDIIGNKLRDGRSKVIDGEFEIARDNVVRGISLLKEAAALGAPEANIKLANFYLSANPPGIDMAISHLKLASQMNYVEGKSGLCMYYTRVAVNGVSESEEAYKWCSIAADNGDQNSMSNMGYLYQNGFGVSVNYELAMHWFLKAASLDVDRAMFHLGEMYQGGQGVPVNLDEARQWYSRAATLGDKEAKKKLSSLKK